MLSKLTKVENTHTTNNKKKSKKQPRSRKIVLCEKERKIKRTTKNCGSKQQQRHSNTHATKSDTLFCFTIKEQTAVNEQRNRLMK